MTDPDTDSLPDFCRTVLPLLHRATKGSRVLDLVGSLVETERWMSFDRCRETTVTLTREYEKAGVPTEVIAIPTGGQAGSGRWVVPEAVDVKGATVDVTSPVCERLLDYQQNPFHVALFSAATPREGIETDLVVIDTESKLRSQAPRALEGKTVLTRLEPRSHLKALSDACAAGVITDMPVPGFPGATAWQKLGFGGVSLEDFARRPVCLSVSEEQGAMMRRLLGRHGGLRLRTVVDTQHYSGMHDLVCGVIKGTDLAEEEVWASAHSMEPGALDNASGVATCVEIAHVLESLMSGGRLPRPRRTIRLISGYECFGPFGYLERVMESRRIFAGVILDAIGARPEVCGRRLGWHASVPMSAGFADRVGAVLLRAVLHLDNPGYQLEPLPFSPSSENFLGDPQYGFPCPWLTTCYKPGEELYDGYHSSADTTQLLSGRGLALSAAAMAGYLYYLAGVESSEVVEASTAGRRRPARRASHGPSGKVPRRIAPLTPHAANLPAELALELAAQPFPAWTLFWADGKRTIREIAACVRRDTGKPASSRALAAYFDVHAKCGYVAWR